jgi:trk system potassium uptake protein TrkH
MSELYKKDLLIILQIVTNMLRMLGFILIIPAVVSIFLSDTQSSELFFFMSLVLVGVFTVIKRFLRIQECRMKHAIISLAIGWISISLISSIPFITHHIGFIDSFFEAFSGWTGTGLTMVKDPSLLPASMNFYRGFIQWVGGFGIVVLALLVYQKPQTAQSLFLAEGRFEDFYIDFSKIARMIVFIYSIYTVVGIGMFWVAGVPLFDAIVHTMTTISTGGFSSNSVGVGLYGKLPMLIAICFMYIGGISFLTHYNIIKGKITKLFGNPEVRFLFLISLAAIVVISFDLIKAGRTGYFTGFFYAVSALTGTGAGTTIPVGSFPAASLTIIILLMICGATYGSTTGALKIWRVMIVLKNVKREIIKPFYPSGTILPIKMGSHVISDEDSLKATVYVLLYIVIVIAGSLLFVIAGYRLFDSVFLVSSAQGNVGLNIVTENYFNMNPLLKLQLIFHMLLGRVEIIPFIAMLRSITAFRR